MYFNADEDVENWCDDTDDVRKGEYWIATPRLMMTT
jgi:hypothetical protein